jgi:hypothetical protein
LVLKKPLERGNACSYVNIRDTRFKEGDVYGVGGYRLRPLFCLISADLGMVSAYLWMVLLVLASRKMSVFLASFMKF